MSTLDRRRELNRLAAQKLRNKRKEHLVNIRSVYFMAQSTNTQLMYELNQLLREKKTLQKKLDEHLRSCGRRSTPNAVESAPDTKGFAAYNITSVVQQPCTTHPATEQTVVKLQMAGPQINVMNKSMQTITVVFSNSPLATSVATAADTPTEVPKLQYTSSSQDSTQFVASMDTSHQDCVSEDAQLYSGSSIDKSSRIDAVEALSQHLPLVVSSMNDESGAGLS